MRLRLQKWFTCPASKNAH